MTCVQIRSANAADFAILRPHMNHTDHVSLIQNGITVPSGTWADLGSGTGAFTLALADLLGPGAVIYSVDRDSGALREQERAMRLSFPDIEMHYITADFSRPLDLPPLDGIIMANSLHFVRDKERILPTIRGYLKTGGKFILVEYNADKGNPWVPHPLSYPTWEKLASRCNLTRTRLLATVPSRFLGEIYSAVSIAP